MTIPLRRFPSPGIFTMMRLQKSLAALVLFLSSVFFTTEVVAQNSTTDTYSDDYTGNVTLEVFTLRSNITPSEVMGVSYEKFNASEFVELATVATLTVISDLLNDNETNLNLCDYNLTGDDDQMAQQINCDTSFAGTDIGALVMFNFPEALSIRGEVSLNPEIMYQIEGAIENLTTLMVEFNSTVGCGGVYDNGLGEKVYDLAVIIQNNSRPAIPETEALIGNVAFLTVNLTAIWETCRAADPSGYSAQNLTSGILATPETFLYLLETNITFQEEVRKILNPYPGCWPELPLPPPPPTTFWPWPF